MKRTSFMLVACCALLVAFGLPAQAGGSLQVRMGGFFLEGESDFWDESENVFTLQASDFDDFIFGFSYSFPFNRYLEADLNIDFFDSTVLSEYRDFTDASGFPILHDSSLQVIPLTVGARWIPFGRGQHGSKRPVFSVGAGAGVNFWEYSELGDFIDFADPSNPIIFGDFQEHGAALASYLSVGLELPVTPGFDIGLEGRWFQSDDDLTEDFAGLGNLDMSGVTASITGRWRF